MQLITSLAERVTVEFSREELRDLHDALSDAIAALDREPGILRDLIWDCEGIEDPEEISGLILDAQREEESVEQLKKALKRAERLLPKVHDLSEGLARIIYP
jgi:hypothetical protein